MNLRPFWGTTLLFIYSNAAREAKRAKKSIFALFTLLALFASLFSFLHNTFAKHLAQVEKFCANRD